MRRASASCASHLIPDQLLLSATYVHFVLYLKLKAQVKGHHAFLERLEGVLGVSKRGE